MTNKKDQTWLSYYINKLKGTNVESEIIRKQDKRWDTLDAIIKNTDKNGRILEAGCGTSILSIILNRQGYKNYCIDNSNDMLDIAKRFNLEAKTGVEYSLGSIFKIPYEDQSFDTVFSHGVIEHFSEEEIVNTINESLRVAKIFVVSFPTVIGKGHPALYGDENLWSYFYWKKIINRSTGRIIQSYSLFSKKSIKGKINRLFQKKLYYISSELGFIIKHKKLY